ncbi:MAG: hypothetical protein NT004_15360 [Bacteroidetes bacterium]|nr:hypothetical protein [Bacteroidota bacterium]
MNLIARKRKRHRRRKPSAGKKFVIESFVTSWVFKIAGVIVLLAGIYYAMNSLDILSGFTDLVGKLFQPSDPSVIEDSKTLDINIIYFFLPGALFLIIAGFIAKRFSFISGILTFLAAISYLGAETYIMIINPGGSHFNPLTITGDIFLALAAIGLFINDLIDH